MPDDKGEGAGVGGSTIADVGKQAISQSAARVLAAIIQYRAWGGSSKLCGGGRCSSASNPRPQKTPKFVDYRLQKRLDLCHAL